MPTIKQKRAFGEMLENGGVVSTAMLGVGYSEAMAKNPQKLTESKGWQELMQEYLPDELLTQKHNQFLNDREHNIGIKALDLAYKLKGSYAPEKSQSVNLNVNATIDPKNKELVDEFESKLFNQYQSE